MIPKRQRRWLLADRPLGRALADSDFRLVEADVGEPSEGEVLLQTLYLDFAPAQKSWMENISSYRGQTEIGDVMPGSGGGLVLKSRHPEFSPGDLATGYTGWEEFPVMAGSMLTKVPEGVPVAAALSMVGVSGKTAYAGLFNIGKPKPGDLLLVSAAAGAVGTIVGQLGKLAGCTTVGIAGGPDKCAWLTDEVGYDHAIDYKNDDLKAKLREFAPKGIDIFFDNVGGEILNTSLSRLAHGARIVICGGITRYNHDPRDRAAMPEGPRNYFNLIFTGATMQGLLLYHFQSEFAQIEQRLAQWVRTGHLRRHEDVQQGFENAPRTLARLFNGQNRGKQLLKLADPIGL
jgi:NADPH-dependent curcumin reductase CurA